MKINMSMSPPPRPSGNASVGDRLEGAFLSEMLKIAMPEPGKGPFHGGIGESQFSSFLIEQHATAIASRIDLKLDSRLEAPNG
ncbi:hypothetical protein SAMN04488075_0586 [Paracoccus alkenifer]|uniref:Rod binding protein n=2 Tax=Paracoccus alkenifer TaxID=65735 RepID=A0A1H6JVT0_9RHOB|nr:hypothetical protein SAMN04488075_0586 [Paracoccus alkenifer]